MLRCLVQNQPKIWDFILGPAKFSYNSMKTHSTRRSLFSIVYAKVPNHTLDLAIIPKYNSQAVVNQATEVVHVIQEVRIALNESNNHYKVKVDVHRRQKVFNLGNLVMIRLRKKRFSSRTYSKLSPMKLGHFAIAKHINDNTYVINLLSNVYASSTFNISDIYPYYLLDNTTTIVDTLGTSSFKNGGNI